MKSRTGLQQFMSQNEWQNQSFVLLRASSSFVMMNIVISNRFILTNSFQEKPEIFSFWKIIRGTSIRSIDSVWKSLWVMIFSIFYYLVCRKYSSHAKRRPRDQNDATQLVTIQKMDSKSNKDLFDGLPCSLLTSDLRLFSSKPRVRFSRDQTALPFAELLEIFEGSQYSQLFV